jgi:CHAT domain-containing protein/Tfp pilus assembly protein PilF
MGAGRATVRVSVLLTLVAGLGMGAIAPTVAQTTAPAVAQGATGEIDRAIAEGMRLFNEGSAESLRKAIAQFEKTLELARSAKSQDKQALSLVALGRIHSDLGENQKAIEYYNQALPIWHAVGDRTMEATTLTNLGAVYFALGENQKAIEYYNQALPIWHAVGDRSGEATTLNNLGLVYSDLGENQKAIGYYNQALPIRRAVGDRRGEATTLNNLGAVYDDLGEKQKAIEYYNQALPILRAVGDRSGEAGTLNNLGFLFASQKQPELAIVFLKQSVNQYEILRRNILTLPKGTQETYVKQVSRTYRRLADLLLKADRILEAQQILDLLKVQEVNAYLKNVRSAAKALYELPPETAILKKYGALQASAIDLGNNLAKLRQVPEKSRTPAQLSEINRLVKLQEELNQQFNQFTTSPDIQKLLDDLSRKVVRQTVDTAQLDALRDDLQKLKAVLIYPLILDDRLELIITTPNSPPLRRTVNVKREEINQAITEFRRVLQNPSQDPKPIAQKLYQWLIKPLEADLQASTPQTLIYAPDANLRYIPLAALHDGSQYLTQRYTINHITAQSLTDLTAQPSKTPKILAGAIGDRPATVAIGGETFNFSGLPYTTREIQAIQTLQPSAIALDGNQFSLPNLKPKFGDYNILHLATHATLVPKSPENSFILFSANTYATLRDIESWTLNNFDLVVLSACETGLGGKFGTNGEEILGLGYQFQTRGAKATIASLWQVNDPATSAYMQRFYNYLAKPGTSKVQAMQTVSRDFITGQVPPSELSTLRAGAKPSVRSLGNAPLDLSHPYYWAPFILIGNGL